MSIGKDLMVSWQLNKVNCLETQEEGILFLYNKNVFAKR